MPRERSPPVRRIAKLSLAALEASCATCLGTLRLLVQQGLHGT